MAARVGYQVHQACVQPRGEQDTLAAQCTRHHAVPGQMQERERGRHEIDAPHGADKGGEK
jgi:hypothetical protein